MKITLRNSTMDHPIIRHSNFESILLCTSGYASGIIIFVIVGVTLSFVDLSVYDLFTKVFNPIMPLLLVTMLLAEAVALLILATMLIKKPIKTRSQAFKTGQTIAIANAVLLALFFLLAQFLPYPP
jgi:hypothetical protein